MSLRTINILNYDDYKEDCLMGGGEPLCYEAYIQCLVDSENITHDVGNMLIEIHRVGSKEDE